MKKKNDSTAVPAPKIIATKGLPGWLDRHKVSFAFTARHTGKLFVAGIDNNKQLSVFERTFESAGGLAVRKDSLFVSTISQVWHLKNGLLPGQIQDGFDRVYLPRTSHTTGDCGIHEMVLNGKNQLVFTNTRFSCLSVLSPSYSFRPIWKPEFISELVPEDRCHLNGVAVNSKGQVTHVTACAKSDTRKGWKSADINAGILMDVAKNKIVLEGLCLPHSPRIHDHRLWLLNSGCGQLGFVDPGSRKFKPVVSYPGFLRGLVFLDHYAIVTVSKPRAAKVFSGLPLEQAMKADQFVPECGILVVDLHTQKVVHRIQIEGIVRELMDVSLIHGSQRPMLMGLKPDEIRNVFSIEPVQNPKKPDGVKNPILV